MSYIGQGLNTDIESNRYSYVAGTSTDAYDGSLTVFPCRFEKAADVFVNGLRISEAELSFNAASVTLASAVEAGDIVDINTFTTWRDADHYTDAAIDLLLGDKADKDNVLEKDNTEAFTPTTDYEPATKKYVDDKAGSGGSGVNKTLSNVMIHSDSLGITDLTEGTGFSAYTYTGNGGNNAINNGIDYVGGADYSGIDEWAGTVGDELVTNGEFDSGTSGWTPKGDASLSVSSGRLRISGRAEPRATQEITTVVGKKYRVSFYGTGTYVALFVGADSTSALYSGGLNSDGTHTVEFTATSTSTSIELSIDANNSSDLVAFFDNVTVKEVIEYSKDVEVKFIRQGRTIRCVCLKDGVTSNPATLFDMTEATFNDWRIDSITNGGMVWVKGRTLTTENVVFDTIRGTTKSISTNTAIAESTMASGITSFNSGGFSSGDWTSLNRNNDNYISWSWQTTNIRSGLTNQGKPYIEEYNPSTGFTQIEYEGSGQAGHILPQSLGRELGMTFHKNLGANTSWLVYYGDDTNGLVLDVNVASSSGNHGWTMADDHVEFTRNFTTLNANNNRYIMYGWASSSGTGEEVSGNFEIGTYRGTGSSGNSFETSDKAAYVLVKRLDSVGDWILFDNKRTDALFPNAANAENGAWVGLFEIQENRFVIRSTDARINASNGQYLYFVVYDNDNGSGKSKYSVPSADSKLAISNGVFMSTDGYGASGVSQRSELFNGNVDFTGASSGKNWVGKELDGNFIFDKRKPRFNLNGTITRFIEGDRDPVNFGVVGYTGTGSSQTVQVPGIDSGVDFVWIKNRDQADTHVLFDSIRGDRRLRPDVTDAEETTSGAFSISGNSFNVSGTAGYMNANNEKYVAWTASLPNDEASNTDGSIVSQTKSNDFMSAISYTGTGVAGTVGHGLSKAPELVITKNRDAANNWGVAYGNMRTYMELHNNVAGTDDGGRPLTAVDATTISLGTSNRSNSDNKYIAYAFTSVEGKCKVGSYSGNGVGNNAIDVGFEPAFVMIKRTNGTGNWYMHDSTRGASKYLRADLNNAEATESRVSFNSSGFTLVDGSSGSNAGTGEYLYLAIAKETPIPVEEREVTETSFIKYPISVINELPSRIDRSEELVSLIQPDTQFSSAPIMDNLSTVDPGVAGMLWNDGGTLKISSGGN